MRLIGPILAVVGSMVLGSAMWAGPIGFVQTNLASDVPGLAPVTDSNLRNAWGMGASATSPVWIGDNFTGTAVLYSGAGVKNPLFVTIPGDGTVTGVLFSNVAGSFNGDTFLFDSEDGTVSGWRSALGTTPGTPAETLVPGDAANVYKGLAGATIGSTEYAYLANFRTGAIDVLKGNTSAPNLTGIFTDPSLPAGYAPFDVQVIGDVLYVTYAVQDSTKHDEVAAPGNGIVDAFDLQGNFKSRIATGGTLNAPWGLAVAPDGFGDLGGDLLVGNFGDGTISAYNLSSGFVRQLTGPDGSPIVIDGLWGLRFGIGGGSSTANTLFFTAGPGGEMHGLFGQLVAAPEPGAWLLVGAGLLTLLKLKGVVAPRDVRIDTSHRRSR
jgi:uncharacterized protein (TIGR03118 family)